MGLTFYLGTHEPAWLGRLDVPLFVSHRRLARRATLPASSTVWALDSGAFSELTLHGRFTTSAQDYARAVATYRREIGWLAWAAPQDWPCEPAMIARTGLSVAAHQDRTVANYLELRAMAPTLPFVPVLQGWAPTDYRRCATRYEAAGVDLARLPLVGLGSVCRRQGGAELAAILAAVAPLHLRLHGFGVKERGLLASAAQLASADSLAWSYHARRRPPLGECAHGHCGNCARYALWWRDRLLARLLAARDHAGQRGGDAHET
jgi:hypothetical protein